MSTLREIRARIRAAKNIQQITRAMKLVSAARLRRAQDRVMSARPYAERMRDIMVELGRAGELPPHPLLEQREVNQVGFIVLASDRGLCGSYNMNIIRAATGEMSKYDRQRLQLVTIGRRANQFYGRRGYSIVGNHSLPNTGATMEDAQQITQQVRDMFESKQVDQVFLTYAKFINPVTQRPIVQQLLPIQPPAEEDGATYDFVFEPPAPELLARLLPRYLFTQVFQAILEATASEHGARMTAMSMASENAGKMIKDLTLTMNRARQAGITKEIAEVVGGAEALR